MERGRFLVYLANKKSWKDRILGSRIQNNNVDSSTCIENKMKADEVAFAGKSDPIICQYAEDYLKKHRRPNIKNSVSNKIRELGRLLIVLRDLFQISSILEALKPENFDKVVIASKKISGYNETTLSFQASSLALHMRTILISVCAGAKSLLLKQNPVLPVMDHKTALKDVSNFRELVESNWKFEMGKENLEDLESFKKPNESALALTILLNRKRVDDVQYIKIDSYKTDLGNNSQEEYLKLLSDSEKLLLKHFKRILIIGKDCLSNCKVAKLLLIGAAVEYQGKTLDKIDIMLENSNEKDTKTNDVLDKDDEELNVTINLRNSDSESNRGEDELSAATEADSKISPALSVTTENNETEDKKKKKKNRKQTKNKR
ncbi:hypothetical protein RN001_005826 [Aquatica leii]|uniref:Uncharacterized protein n=1 Tax=Aquatica leii TaxID=1421715 RepID=A0AAN7PCC8_9COLE|nr:hypothetical protein RN001_005826 [Aquatica leii]